MQRAAIVPHHKIVDAPSVRVYELTLSRVSDWLIDERHRFSVQHPENVPNV